MLALQSIRNKALHVCLNKPFSPSARFALIRLRYIRLRYFLMHIHCNGSRAMHCHCQ